jgi:serine protease Do
LGAAIMQVDGNDSEQVNGNASEIVNASEGGSLPGWQSDTPFVSSPNQCEGSRSISFLVLGAPENETGSVSLPEIASKVELSSKSPSAPQVPPSGGNWSSKMLVLLASICVLLLMGMLGPRIAQEMQSAITRGKMNAEHEFASRELGKPNSSLAEISKACQLVSYRISPSVVHIDTVERNLSADVTQSAFERQSNGQGSGVIIDAKGFIITNYHVVRGARQIMVGLSDGRPVKGEVLAFDLPTDIAILRVRADNLVAAEWGDSNELEIGNFVWAVGSPYGLDHSVTFGTISGKNRGGIAGTAHQNFLQTDVAVNPGNSGGPLVDSRGRVVGINTAIVGQSYQGISFAIPSNVVKHIYDRLLDKGRVDRGWLGVQLGVVSPELAATHGLVSPRGAVVNSLTSEFGHNSPAEAAGVKVGDIVRYWDGRSVANPAQLIQFVSETLAGASVKIQVVREGQEIDIVVVIGARPLELN